MRGLGLEFRVIPPPDEDDDFLKKRISLERIPSYLWRVIRKKAEPISKTYPKSLVIAADTLVFLPDLRHGDGSQQAQPTGYLIGKPGDESEAKECLKLLSGRVHKVLTGLYLKREKPPMAEFDIEVTRVTFNRLSEREILSFIRTGLPFDKAGGYAIQGPGSLLVKRIEGCYYNVVGLPLSLLAKMFRCAGLPTPLEKGGW